MFYFKCIIVISNVFNYLDLVQSLIEMPPIEENEIVKSEAIIRNTFNGLFYNLKLKKMKENPKLNDYLIVHKYFTSLALQDFVALNKIARIVKVNYKNTNKTTNFMGIINNMFSQIQFAENNKNKLTNNVNVASFILYFLKILRKLKETNNFHETYLNINKNILKHLNAHRKQTNESLNSYKSDKNTIINDLLNKNELWEPSGRRIFKGDRTKIKHFPFMASIQIFNNFHCAGSIIKSDLIITASSCLQLAWNNRLFRENPAFLSARVGSSFYSGGGEVIPVLEIYFHPEYNPKNLRNNICILRLARHLNFRRRSKRIKKIDFDREPSSMSVTTPGITILGWGAKEHSHVIGNPWKNILSVAVLHVYPLKDCRDVYSREYVNRKNFCAGFFSRGGGACNHDVGGPGIADGKLMGVISFGSPVCGTPDAPTVFTKLGYYSDWVEEIMEMDVPVSMKRTTLKPLHDQFTAPPSYSPSISTTFKIQTLTGEKMTPIPMSHIDNQLRIFDDNVFKDFLATMFNSKEVDVNQDAKYNKESKKLETTVKYAPKYYEGITENEKHVTEFKDVSTEGSEARNEDTAVTLIKKENEHIVPDFDEDIQKFIDNVNLEEIVKEEVMVTPSVGKVMNEGENMKSKSLHKYKNDSVLTLLYLSDDDKKENEKIISLNDNMNDEREEGTGLSIPVDFEDLTRTKDKIVQVLPESDLFRLLSEVIGQEIPNKDLDNS